METLNKTTLEWLRQVRNDMYEDWRDNPLEFDKKNEKRFIEAMKRHGLYDTDKVIRNN